MVGFKITADSEEGRFVEMSTEDDAPTYQQSAITHPYFIKL